MDAFAEHADSSCTKQPDRYGDGSFKAKMHRKRCVDFGLSTLLVIMIAPLLLVIAICVKISDRGSVFFVHRRVGLAGQTFGCLKFRTMRPGSEQVLHNLLRNDSTARKEWAQTRKLRRDPRVTRIGRLLRITSLDELPQIFNVLRGDMSLVGPRPVTTDELICHYKGEAGEAYRAVRPGLTGPWQVSGRSNVDYQKRVALDFEYVHDFSLRTDAYLVWRTVVVLLYARGAY